MFLHSTHIYGILIRYQEQHLLGSKDLDRAEPVILYMGNVNFTPNLKSRAQQHY